MPAFDQQGLTVTFTAAATAPTAVQCVSNEGGRASGCYLLTNTGSTTVFVGYSAFNATEAQTRSTIPTATPQYCLPVPPGSQISFSGPPDAYFSGVTSGGSAVVYVTPGYGE